MSKVQTAIEQAAVRFAREIVAILRSATLADILAIAGKSPTGELAQALRSTNHDGRSADRRRDGHSSRDGDGVSAPREARAGRKRSRQEVDRLAERVFQHLSANRGDHAVSAIAEALGVPTSQLGLPLQRLKNAGRIRAEGQKRSTVYRAG